ncbi:BRCT domain-containing protein [Psittacicella gerlachiana]|uniref:DNA ligase n=1 Tax=Psittacicella gerlachiana TaxID=2028574 RepID=A0A3A1YEQ0_9GAMM|nr:BRCT domain-containing protein [Psittacicella gerlachiana]RIY34537.1 hypothetical protein CKF59_05390 [Psittacicella gerlachiana]
MREEFIAFRKEETAKATSLTASQLLERLEFLRKRIQELKISYYQNSESKVSDFEYDYLVRELEYYENTYTDFYLEHFANFVAKDQVGSDLRQTLEQEVIIASEQEEQEASEQVLYAELLQSKSQFADWQLVHKYSKVSDEQIEQLASEYQAKIVEHDIPMLSLGNVYNGQEFAQFYESIAKAYLKEQKLEETKANLKKVKVTFCAEPKFDGIACSLIYRNGKLVSGATRGDGSKGYDITAHVMRVPNIPQEIPELIEQYQQSGLENILEIRGELIMLQQDFEYLNNLYLRHNRRPLANLRNGAGAFVSRETYRRVVRKYREQGIAYQDLYIIDNLPRQMPLRFMAYAINQHENIQAPEIASDTHYDLLMFARRLGFTVSDLVQLVTSTNQIESFYQGVEQMRPGLDFDIDGTVFKVNNLTDQEMVGWIANSPKWATAYKFLPNEAKTELLDVVTNVGRTGVVSPVAKVEPCFVGGVTISSLTLHNYYLLKRMDLHQQDKVIIYRGGEVIPVVKEAVVAERKAEALPVNILPTCPECGSFLAQDTRLQQLNVQNDQDLVIADFNELKHLTINYALKPAIDLPLTQDPELLKVAKFLALEEQDLAQATLKTLKKSQENEFALLKDLLVNQYLYEHSDDALKRKEYAVKFQQSYNLASKRKEAANSFQRYKIIQSGSLSCTNSQHNCQGQLNGQIEFFFSKDGIELKGLGPNIIELFVTLGAVTNYADVYKFSQDNFLPQVSDLAKTLVVHEPAYTLAYKLRAEYIQELQTKFKQLLSTYQVTPEPNYLAYRQRVEALITQGKSLATLFTPQDYAHFVDLQQETYKQLEVKGTKNNYQQSFKEILLANAHQDYVKTFNAYVKALSRHNAVQNQALITFSYFKELVAKVERGEGKTVTLLEQLLTKLENELVQEEKEVRSNFQESRNKALATSKAWAISALRQGLEASYPQVVRAKVSVNTSTSSSAVANSSSNSSFKFPEYIGGHINLKLNKVEGQRVLEFATFALEDKEKVETLITYLEQELCTLYEQIFTQVPAFGVQAQILMDFASFSSLSKEEILILSTQERLVSWLSNQELVADNFYAHLHTTSDFEEKIRQEQESLAQKTRGYPWVEEFMHREQEYGRDQRDYILTHLSRFTSPQVDLEQRLGVDAQELLRRDFVQPYSSEVKEHAQELAKGKHLEVKLLANYAKHSEQEPQESSLFASEPAHSYQGQTPEFFNQQLASYLASGSLLSEQRFHSFYQYLRSYAQMLAPVPILKQEQVSQISDLVWQDPRLGLEVFEVKRFVLEAQKTLTFNQLYARVELLHRFSGALALVYDKQLNELKVTHNVGIFSLDPLLDQNSETELQGLLNEHEHKLARVGENLDLFLNSKEVNFTKLGYSTRSLILANLCDFLKVMEQVPAYGMIFASRMEKYFALLAQDAQTRENQFKALLAPYKQKLKVKPEYAYALDYNWKLLTKTFMSKELFGGKVYSQLKAGLEERMTLKIADFFRSIGINGVGDSASVELVSPQLLPNIEAVLDFKPERLAQAVNYALALRFLQGQFKGNLAKVELPLAEILEANQQTTYSQEVATWLPGLYTQASDSSSYILGKISPHAEVLLKFVHADKVIYRKYDLASKALYSTQVLTSEFESLESPAYVLNLAQALEAPTFNLIGEVTFKNIVDYFTNPNNLEVISQLLSYGVSFKENKPEFSNAFANKKVCITGGLEQMDRKAFNNFIKESGGKFSSSVTNELDILVVAGTQEQAKPSSKLKKAQELGKRIMYEPEFMEIYGQSVASKE